MTQTQRRVQGLVGLGVARDTADREAGTGLEGQARHVLSPEVLLEGPDWGSHACGLVVERPAQVPCPRPHSLLISYC